MTCECTKKLLGLNLTLVNEDFTRETYRSNDVTDNDIKGFNCKWGWANGNFWMESGTKTMVIHPSQYKKVILEEIYV